MLPVVGDDQAADDFADGGDDGVAEGSDAGRLQPVGKPISHSTASPLGLHEPVDRMNPRTRSVTDGRMRRPVPPSGFARIGHPERPMLAVGVGHHEQAFPHVWCTHGARGKHRPLRIEP